MGFFLSGGAADAVRESIALLHRKTVSSIGSANPK